MSSNSHLKGQLKITALKMKCSIELHKIKLTNLLIQFCLCFLVLSCKIKSHADKHVMAFQAHSNNNKQRAVPLQPLHPPKRKTAKCSPAARGSRLRTGKACSFFCCRCAEFGIFIAHGFFVRDAHFRNLTSVHRNCNTACVGKNQIQIEPLKLQNIKTQQYILL